MEKKNRICPIGTKHLSMACIECIHRQPHNLIVDKYLGCKAAAERPEGFCKPCVSYKNRATPKKNKKMNTRYDILKLTNK
jgi:hypothetical protein